MEPIRKESPDVAHFPFELNHRIAKYPQHELPDHFHDWYELVYIYKGEGRKLPLL